jgi:serine/threonine-protein kinase RsbW
MDTLRIPAKLESWDSIRLFVLEKVEQLSVDPEVAFKVELALEELVVNVIYYAYQEDDGDLEIGCTLEDRTCLCISIRDWGRAFNPLDREAPDISQDISERKVGGLGVHLVKQMVDRIDYESLAGGNMLTLRFTV